MAEVGELEGLVAVVMRFERAEGAGGVRSLGVVVAEEVAVEVSAIETVFRGLGAFVAIVTNLFGSGYREVRGSWERLGS